jgi:hypothetical protein
MDYSFAPGTTSQDGRARQMFSRRPDTTLIRANRRRSTVKQFIDHITDEDDITKPVGDHLIATHANSQGFIFIPLFPGQSGPTDFETIQKTIDEAEKSIEINDDTIGYTAGDPVTKGFHIKGCNIGKTVPFLEKMKEALGGNVEITAPIHFHVLHWLSRLGIFEGMAYEFNFNRKEPYESRDEVLTTFRDEGFLLYDGSAVPDDSWENWLPARISKNQLKTRQRLSRALRVNIGAPIDTTSTLSHEIQFRVTPNTFTYTIEYPDRASVPTETADRETALEDALNADDLFSSSHEFPMYERWGYDSIDNFIAGYNWRFNRNGKNLVCRGTRYEYTLSPPVLDISTDNYIFNFYPNEGSPNPAILYGLLITDNQFYQTV